MILDVVYNHIGPGSEAIAAFGPYFTDRHDTFWGDALDYSQRGVREWAIQNAELWMRDYRDRRPAPRRRARDLRRRRRRTCSPSWEAARRRLVISEMNTEDLRPLDEWGHDAQCGSTASTTSSTFS